LAGSFNKVILVGNLVRDPEIRYIASGAAVTKFTLAVNRRSKDKEETDFIDINAWDKLGEICNTYLKKGASCLIEGRLSIRSYDDAKIKDQTGKPIKRKATEIVASTMQMLGSKPGEGAHESHEAHEPTVEEALNPHSDLDDEVPL